MRRLAPVALLLLAAACGPGAPSRLDVGDRAPDFVAPALAGGELDSRALAGRATVLSFWATWCRPCLAEIPELTALAGSGRARVVAIALDLEGERTVGPFVEEQGIDYTVLLGDQELFASFRGFAIPYTLVLDPSWRVVNLYRGPATRAELERDLDSLAPAVASEGPGEAPRPRRRSHG